MSRDSRNHWRAPVHYAKPASAWTPYLHKHIARYPFNTPSIQSFYRITTCTQGESDHPWVYSVRHFIDFKNKLQPLCFVHNELEKIVLHTERNVLKYYLRWGGGAGFGKHLCINFIEYENMSCCTPKVSTITRISSFSNYEPPVLFIKQATTIVVKTRKTS